MPKMVVEITDEAFAHYEFYASELAKTPAQVASMQLQRYAEVNPVAGYAMISDETKKQIEELLGGLPLTTAEDLIGRIENLASVGIGKVRLRWTAAQMEQFKYKANREGVPLDRFLELKVRRVLEDHGLDAIPRVGEMLECKEQMKAAQVEEMEKNPVPLSEIKPSEGLAGSGKPPQVRMVPAVKR